MAWGRNRKIYHHKHQAKYLFDDCFQDFQYVLKYYPINPVKYVQNSLKNQARSMMQIIQFFEFCHNSNFV